MIPFIFLFPSCGYRWQPEYPSSERPTVWVPFAVNDEDGLLTAEIIRTLSASGLVDVSHYRGDFRLEVSIDGNSNDLIGFRRDPQKIKGKVRKNLLACEGRRTIHLTATLFEGNSERIAYGPYKIAADAEYDYVDGDSILDLTFVGSTGALTPVLPFSLGQLESIDSAQEAANRPLYSHLAQKIVDVISAEW